MIINNNKLLCVRLTIFFVRHERVNACARDREKEKAKNERVREGENIV